MCFGVLFVDGENVHESANRSSSAALKKSRCRLPRVVEVEVVPVPGMLGSIQPSAVDVGRIPQSPTRSLNPCPCGEESSPSANVWPEKIISKNCVTGQNGLGLELSRKIMSGLHSMQRSRSLWIEAIYVSQVLGLSLCHVHSVNTARSVVPMLRRVSLNMTQIPRGVDAAFVKAHRN